MADTNKVDRADIAKGGRRAEEIREGYRPTQQTSPNQGQAKPTPPPGPGAGSPTKASPDKSA